MPNQLPGHSDGADGPPPPPYQGAQYQSNGRSGYSSTSFRYYSSHSGNNNRPPGQTQRASEHEPLLPKLQASQSCLLPAVFLLLGIALGFCLDQCVSLYGHENLRRQWQESEGRWRSDRAFMEQERLKWAREREERREEEMRQRNRMTWEGLVAAGQCMRYGTREYTATLTNVPLGFNAIAECQNKSIDIHGKQWFPDRCENQGICGSVTGHWIVDSNEPLCTTWWDHFVDKGCKNGFRVYDAHLQNLQRGDDWRIMCSTTPTNIKGIHFATPNSCVDWGRNRMGSIGGIWHLSDYNCR